VFETINFKSPEMQSHVWIATGGAMLVLVQSILSGTRRVWWRLLLSCMVGGASATLAGYVFGDSKFVYAICGVAAIVGENVIFGLFKASEQFKESPIEVFSKLWRLVMPTFGKSVGDPAVDTSKHKDAPVG
jgi:hypothetical protein